VSPGGKILLIEQERLGLRSWGSGGGALEYDETIEECAIREALEEAGLSVRLTRLLSVDQFWHRGRFKGVGFVFLATPDPWPQPVRLPDRDPNGHSAKFLASRWVTRGEAQEMLPAATPQDLWTVQWPPDISATLIHKLEFDSP